MMAKKSVGQQLSSALRDWIEELELDQRLRALPTEVWAKLSTICAMLNIQTSELIGPALSVYREAESWFQENLVGGNRPGHLIEDLLERIGNAVELLEGSS
jgi:hypothetical protein